MFSIILRVISSTQSRIRPNGLTEISLWQLQFSCVLQHLILVVSSNSNRSYKLYLSAIFQYDCTIYISRPKSMRFLFTISTLPFIFCVNPANNLWKSVSAIARVLSLFVVIFQACVPYKMTRITSITHLNIPVTPVHVVRYLTLPRSPSDILNNPLKSLGNSLMSRRAKLFCEIQEKQLISLII